MHYQEEYKDCLAYIDTYWDKIIHDPTRRKFNYNVITIPYTYITPNDKKFDYIFYWDSFFMFRGLMGTKREWVIKDMVNNFAYLLDTYHVIPNFNSHASTGRSQPPFFSSMIFDGYYTAVKRNPSMRGKIRDYVAIPLKRLPERKRWLKTTIEIAKKEYAKVWADPENLYHHTVPDYKLNRYGDRDIGYALSSELESGWDLTARFYNRCNEFLPIDLNSFLYKYEWDFARAARILGERDNETYWLKQAHERRDRMTKLMWNEKKGYFFDYDYMHKNQSEFYSLAGFAPLWAGLATKAQADKVVANLKYFETSYGLVVTAKESMPPKLTFPQVPKAYRYAVEALFATKQWDYPSNFPPVEYLAVIGLLRYGFIDDAVRIMKKSLEGHAKVFRKTGTFHEKINGVEGDEHQGFHYPNQGGFGWTNAVFYRYIQILTTLEAGETIYSEPKGAEPPYNFSILH